MKTTMPKAKDIEQKWYIVDAEGKILGRLASKVAFILRGKHRPEFAPHMDFGDHIIIINADKIRVTGRKAQQKHYVSYSGYPGGLKTVSYTRMLREHPERILFHAIKGMLPHNRLGRKLLKKVRIYAGPDHPHQAQQPEPLEL
ncbi:MAG: 50S ribosomal protein L13 [Calditrichaeota bacterium]|nr:50S ribosomal protein L13 [Calditrichota bacterium]